MPPKKIAKDCADDKLLALIDYLIKVSKELVCRSSKSSFHAYFAEKYEQVEAGLGFLQDVDDVFLKLHALDDKTISDNTDEKEVQAVHRLRKHSSDLLTVHLGAPYALSACFLPMFLNERLRSFHITRCEQ